MKNRVYMVAAALVLLSGCNKEADKAPERTPGKTYTITASVENPSTRSITALNETTDKYEFSWTENERIAVLPDGDFAKLTFNVVDPANGTFRYTARPDETEYSAFGMAVTPADALSYDNDNTSFVDGTDVDLFLNLSGVYYYGQSNAVMVAGAPSTVGEYQKFSFHHAAALAKVTYENVPADASYMVFSTPDHAITGTFRFTSLEGVELVAGASQNDDEAWVILQEGDVPAATADFYLPIPTGNYTTFNVCLKDADDKIIAGSDREFKTSGTAFKVARADVVEFPVITLTPQTLEGEWIMVGAHENSYYAAQAYESGNNLRGTSVTVANDVVTSESYIPVKMTFTYVSEGTYAGMYTIRDNNGKYLYAASNSGNYLKAEDAISTTDPEHYYWTIEEEEDGIYSIIASKSDNRKVLRFNYNGGEPLFACYASASQSPVQLYRWTDASIPDAPIPTCETPLISCTNNVITITTSTEGASIYYELGTTAENTADPTDASTLYNPDNKPTISANTYIKAIAYADGYSPSEIAGQALTYESGDTKYYVKVTSAPSAPADWSGQYLIVYEKDNVAFNGGLKSLDAVNNTIDVTIESGKIKSNSTTDAAAFAITPVSSGYSIKSASGYYIGRTANSNGMDTSDSEAYVNTLKYANSAVAITSSGGPVLKYNDASNQNRFRYYGSGQKAIQLYKLEDKRTAAGISWSANSASATIADGDVVTFTAPTLSNPNNLTVSYSSTDLSVATISNAGVVSILDGGTTTIRAAFAGDATYKPATAEYILTVTDNRTPVVSYDFETIAELNALVTSTSYTYSGKLTNAVVSFVPTANTAIVKDATGSVMFYKSTQDGGHGLLQGQTYTGDIEVTAVKYNDLYSEITVWDAVFTGNETPVAPESVTLASLVGNYDDYQNAYVQVANLTVTNVNNKNITVTSGTDSYEVYFNPNGTVPCGVGDVITAVGTVTKYGSTEQIKVWDANDITVTTVAPKAITFTQPSAGGSFTVSVGGNTITSGTTVASGTTVTLTATPANDYTFDGWTVTGATVADASAATTTFTMGTSAVNISASFSSTGGPAEYTIQWGPSYNSKSVSGYIENWDATMDGFTVNMANWNNNNNSWNYVKCGRKNNSSVATIITDTAIPEAIKTVTITIDALTASKINSITLYASSSKTSGWTSVGTFTKAVGNQSVIISSPASNKYYKIEVDCASGSSNGLLTLSKAVYTTN